MRSELQLNVAWYREDQYDRLRSLAADRDNLASSYADWKATAQRMTAELIAVGQMPRRVEVDVELLWAWCCASGRPLDGPARAEYVAGLGRGQSAGADG